jgi:hypothetical protein
LYLSSFFFPMVCFLLHHLVNRDDIITTTLGKNHPEKHYFNKDIVNNNP